MKSRTKQLALAVVRFAATLPSDPCTAIMARQLVKSATSVGANYRSACRAKSTADFISKMGTTEEEADETVYWMELLVESDRCSQVAAAGLIQEAEQILRIVVASIRTARLRLRERNRDRT